MKLSEVLSQPIKLAGGGILDLRGFVKVIKDKEVSMEPVQADWNQSDNTKLDYIKNKPSIAADALVVHPTKGDFVTVSNLTFSSEDAAAMKSAFVNGKQVLINHYEQTVCILSALKVAPDTYQCYIASGNGVIAYFDV